MVAENSLHVVGSSVLVVFYHGGDSCHKQAVDALKKLDGATLLIHPFVVQEVTSVLAYRIGKKVADDFLSDILNSANVRLVNPDLHAESEFFRSLDERISFTDASLILLARQSGADLLTFDRQMEAINGRMKRADS